MIGAACRGYRRSTSASTATWRGRTGVDGAAFTPYELKLVPAGLRPTCSTAGSCACASAGWRYVCAAAGCAAHTFYETPWGPLLRLPDRGPDLDRRGPLRAGRRQLGPTPPHQPVGGLRRGPVGARHQARQRPHPGQPVDEHHRRRPLRGRLLRRRDRGAARDHGAPAPLHVGAKSDLLVQAGRVVLLDGSRAAVPGVATATPGRAASSAPASCRGCSAATTSPTPTTPIGWRTRGACSPATRHHRPGGVGALAAHATDLPDGRGAAHGRDEGERPGPADPDVQQPQSLGGARARRGRGRLPRRP